MASNRIVWLDVGKGIAIICVVLGHCIVGLDSPIKHAIFSFHMPLFFIYSGITLHPKPGKAALVSSFKRLIIPFMLLFSISVLLVLVRSSGIDIETFKNIGLTLLFSSAVIVKPWGYPAIGMIWFLMVLFISRLITNASVRAFEARNVNTLVQLLVFAFAAAVGIVVGRHWFLPLSFDLVPLACFFIYVGYATAKENIVDRLLGWRWCAVAFFVWLLSFKYCWFSMGDRMFDLAPLAIAGALAATILVSKVSKAIEDHVKNLCKFFSYCGINSLLILALHYIEGRMVAWAQMPLIAMLSAPASFYVMFIFRFALIICIVLIVSLMPVMSQDQSKKAE